jgi:Uma2 family endonuclease
MTPLLDLPDVRERVHRLSVADYHRLGESGVISENVELLRGILVDKVSKSPLHEYVSQKLLKVFHRIVPEQFDVRQERPVSLADSEPEPDFSIVKGAPEDWIDAHPATASLVIEIAISSLILDRSKAEIYSEAGIPEYWLIRADERLVDVYRQPSPKGFLSKVTLGESDVLASSSIPQINVLLSQIFPPR